MNNEINILLVDDDPDSLQVLEALLDHPEYNLIKASSGKAALKVLLETKTIALIVIDIRMPDMDAFEAIEIVRKNDRYKHISVLFVSSYYINNQKIFQTYQAGTFDFLSKPYNSALLKSKVSMFVQQYTYKIRIDDLNQKLKEYEKIEQKLEHEKRQNDLLTQKVMQLDKLNTEQHIKLDEMAHKYHDMVSKNSELLLHKTDLLRYHSELLQKVSFLSQRQSDEKMAIKNLQEEVYMLKVKNTKY